MAALIVPPLVTQGNNLIQNAARATRSDLQRLRRRRTRALRKLEEDYDITGKLEEQAGEAARAGSATRPACSATSASASSTRCSPAITILVLSVFMLGSGRGWLDALRASRTRPSTRELAAQRLLRPHRATPSATTSAGALRRRRSPACSPGSCCSILGVPYAAALAVVIFLLDLVPLVGATLGAIIVGVVTLFNDFPTDTIVWVIFSIVYQQVENTRHPAAHPGARGQRAPVRRARRRCCSARTLFGVLGALLAIPVAAAIQIAIREYCALPHTTRRERASSRRASTAAAGRAAAARLTA